MILDYIFGEGICQYISFNWGPKIWISLLGLIALLLFGNSTSHRTFTHSFLGITSISLMIYILCKPFAICFVLGYASHLLADFFNKLGLQLFYPLKWRFCLKVCASDKKGNRILFWITLTINIILSAILFSNAITSDLTANNLFQFIKNSKFLGLNLFQIYLIVINIITFCSMQANFNYFINNLSEGIDIEDTIENEFYVWVIDFLVFSGGGLGMLVSLIINFAYPAAYNGMWWAFCYSSIIFWTTTYCYICNPFKLVMQDIIWMPNKHIPVLVYVIVVNFVSAIVIRVFRRKHFDEYNIRHTLVWILGAFGGTIGAIITAFAIHRDQKYYYVTRGFFIMLLCQIILTFYLLKFGII